MMQVVAFSRRLLAPMLRRRDPFPYVLVAEAKVESAPPNGQERKAWLGTIPDFTEEVTGVKLAGVIDGSPAQRAGLARGDILVEFMDRPVANLAAFTQELRSCEPGQHVNLEVLRDGRRLQYIVILADRRDRER
jgi:aminopeptidase N